ncbi:MAG: methyltransferase domain-containing protein [Magnetococcales bacterium]|nr:methyltransferase domain-containing protein [Magnetococcales bacterium]
MNFEAIRLQSWYATPQGRTVARVLGEALESWVRPRPLERTLGFGFVQPYLGHVISGREGALGAAPAEMGVAPWPPGGDNRICLVRPNAQPFPDQSFDRVVVAHLLEGCGAPSLALREIWRILRPGGRLFMIVANRGGLWARHDSTPFGWGQPFSPRQLRTLLQNAVFVPHRCRYALFMPPFFQGRRFLHTAAAWEKAGERWFPRLGGGILCEAEKVVYAGTPLRLEEQRVARRSPAVWPVTNQQLPTLHR